VQLRPSGMTGQRSAYSFDGNPAYAARLRVTYALDMQLTTYAYDEANRLMEVDGTPYTWDDNGNLVSDGEKTYTYNQANRLTNISATGLTWSASYNGEGARLKQIVNGAPTTYTLDLTAPLVQVLVAKDSSGDTRYLYGVTRIGERQSAGWLYHLTDALGSVRQLTDNSGTVQLARGYTPYGEPLWTNGMASSRYTFTGEDYDPTVGLVFLRARYMQPTLGIFLARDPVDGNDLRPESMNGWGYANDAPSNYTDPSGRCVFCNGGDAIRVDGRDANGNSGVLVVRQQPNNNAPEVARIADNQRVQVGNALRVEGPTEWRQVYVSLRQADGREGETGWVPNLKLLDNCSGDIGPQSGFSCMPVAGSSSTYGFGPSQFAYENAKVWYSGLRGLHNGLDFVVPAGTDVVWMGTSNNVVLDNPYPNDAASPAPLRNIVIDYENKHVLFGHMSASYVEPGDSVRPGQTIGKSGSDHLHLGYRKDHVFYNPLFYFSSDLQGLIVSRIEPYVAPYDYYSMFSFDNYGKKGELTALWFWDKCPSFKGILMTD
jgi:RHS repeat-associated protein